MSSSVHGTYVGDDEIRIHRELWALVIGGLDGDLGARDEARHRLIAAAPVDWDADLDDDGGSGWQPARPVAAPQNHGEPWQTGSGLRCSL